MFSERAQERLLALVAALVFALAAVRAAIQSLTFDEAFSYLYFAKSLAGVGEFNTNNHVLNSLLMWAATQLFGNAEIVVRLPALLGAAVYIAASYFLCLRLTDRFTLRLAMLMCLTLNPLILDFMAAARGYGLANAFLLAAIAAPLLHGGRAPASLVRACALASVALGLSFAANYSFAFVNLAAFMAILTWAMRRRGGESAGRIFAACALPGLAAALLICGYPLSRWEAGNWRQDLWWGAHSVRETAGGLIQSALHQPNRLLGPAYAATEALGPWILAALAILCLARLAALATAGFWRYHDRARRAWEAIVLLGGVTILAAGASWLAFRLFGLPLPTGRTGIYFLPLATLLCGAIAAAPGGRPVARWAGRGVTAGLLCLALYFVACIRISHFKEYPWNADNKEIYSILARLNHTYGVVDVQVAGLYMTSMNYYRERSGRESFPEFLLSDPEVSPGHAVYVLGADFWREFLDQERLAVIHRGKYSDVAIAVSRDGPVPPDPVSP